MTHWGWYWRVKHKDYNPKTLCSKLPSIDSFQIFKKQKAHIFRVPQYNLTGIPRESLIEIFYGQNSKPAYSIITERQKCHYGGYRYFFNCPLCKQRMRKLYFSNGAFLCRKCLNLSYKSQRLRPSKRYEYMMNKLEEEVTKKKGCLALNKRPKHMHQTTYTRLKNQLFDYEAKCIIESENEIACWFSHNTF